jgi:NAD(P)-dependent dehydrogenase (short-subunit alcohol dehydrogenase family)
MKNNHPKKLPPQRQDTRPGRQKPMRPQPASENEAQRASGKLQGRAALITGGDSGIGRAIAVAFAREGADIAIGHLAHENKDAADTKRLVEEAGTRCISLTGDIGNEATCQKLVAKTVGAFGRLDILINNAGEQHPQERIEDITAEQLERTFRTNIFSMFFLTKAAMPHLKKGSAIVNNASVTAYRGHPMLLDYSSTKGAIVAFTRSLSLMVADKGIRVNTVAPGPIWTPLIPSTFPPEKVKKFG